MLYVVLLLGGLGGQCVDRPPWQSVFDYCLWGLNRERAKSFVFVTLDRMVTTPTFFLFCQQGSG